MIISVAATLKKRNINYQNSLLVEATDISDICAYMTYIQLSLYGIPAIVYCGDSVTREIRFKMETPFFFLNYWKFRKFYIQDENNKQEEIVKNNNKIIINKPIENYNEVTVKGNNQICLW